MIGFGRPTFDICPGGLAFNGTPFQTYLPNGQGYGHIPPLPPPGGGLHVPSSGQGHMLPAIPPFTPMFFACGSSSLSPHTALV